MPQELQDLIDRSTDELEAAQPDWDALEIAERAVSTVMDDLCF